MLFVAVKCENKSVFLFVCLSLLLSLMPFYAYGQTEDLSEYVKITTANEKSALDPRTRMITSTADVTITNSSNRTVTAPLHAVIDMSASGVQIPEALGGIGTDPYGKYYYDLTGKLPDGVLAPGNKVTFGVKFVRYYTVRFTYNILPYGILPGDPLLKAPTAIDFGAVMEEESAIKDVTVSNIGTAPLVVSEATLTGEGFHWPEDSAPVLPFTLSPGQSVNLQIAFTPESGTGGTTLSGVLSLDSNGGSADVALTGNAVAPVVLQNLIVLDARVKNGEFYDRITDNSCASVGGEVLFGDGVLPSDTFVVTLTDQTDASVSSADFLAPQNGNTAGFGDINACNLKDGIITVTVKVIHNGDVQDPMTGTPAAKSTASLTAPVLNPVDSATVFSTIDVCGTAPTGTLVQINGGSGLVSTQLTADQTRFCLEVPLRHNAENTLIASATDLTSGLVATAPPIKTTQVDPSSAFIAQASSRPLTEAEIKKLVDDGVIILDDPSNFNVSMFTIVLTIGQFPATITQPVVVSPTPGIISYGGGGGWNGGSVTGSEPAISSSMQVVVIQTPTGQTIPGVIIIDGRIKTLKEFFQVTIVIQNTTTQFELMDMTADIDLPSGLSPVKAGLGTDVATINTGSATDTVTIGTIGPQQTGTGQFIIRGDGIGTHNVSINFQGFLSGVGLADPYPITGSAGTTVKVFGPPELDVVVRHPGDPNSPNPDVTAGEIYTMTVDITNRSPVPALYTSLELLVGQGAVLVDTDGNEIPGSSTVRNLGNIQPGQTASQAFRVKAKLTGKIIACQAITSENINLSVDIGGGSCNIVNTIPVNFQFPPANEPPTIIGINPLNNQSNIPITTSVAAILTAQIGCITADTWANVVTDWIDASDHGKGTQVVSADLVSIGTFYLEEMDNAGNPVRHIPADLTVTPGVDGQTSIAVLRLGLASPLSQYFLKPNTLYRATLVGGNGGICNANLNTVTLPNTYQWTFSTAQNCTGVAPPTVTLSQPLDGATGQPLNQKIVLNFNQRMNPASFTFDPDTLSNSSILILAGGTETGGDVSGGTPVPGTLVFSNLLQSLTFTPTVNLPTGETIYVRLRNTIKDVCGNSLQTPANGVQLFSFTTNPPDTTPPNAPIVNPLPATTNQPTIQVSGIAEAGSLITVTGGAKTTSTTTSPSGLFSVMVSLNLNAGNNLQVVATDASDNVSPSVTTDKNGSKLSVVQDSVSPTVISLSPADGSTNVGRNTAVSVVFSKDIKPGTVNSLNFSITGTTTVAGTFTLNGADGFTFTPAALLDYGQTYTVRMRAGGISDTVGNPLADTFSSTFVTEAFPTPALTQVAPSSGGQGTTFDVTFTGTNLATASAVVSDNPGVSGVIASKTDTSVTASITIDPQAATGATTLGVTTNGGSEKLAFTVKQKPPIITAITPNQGEQGSTVDATITGAGLTNVTSLTIDGEGVTVTDLGTGNDSHLNVQLTITAGAASGDRTVTITTPGGVATCTFVIVPLLQGLPTHVGAKDPITENFLVSLGIGSSKTEPIDDDLGHNVWSITGLSQDSQFAYNSGALTDVQKAYIANQGFVLTFGARVLQGSAPAYDTVNHVVIGGAHLYTDTKRFDIALGVDGNEDTVVVLPYELDFNGPGNSVRAPGPNFTLTGLGSSYHTYQLVFNPSTQLADLYVDGIKRIQNYAGLTSWLYNRGLEFGAGCGGQTNFDYVDLTIGSQDLPAPTVTQISRTDAPQGDTFNVTFTGANLKTVNAVISDNPGMTGSIIGRSETEVTAIITIGPQAVAGVTTLGLSTLGGTAKLPFTISPSSCVQAPSGLVSWWKGEWNTADTVDGNQGTLIGPLTYTLGKVGRAFNLPGSFAGDAVGARVEVKDAANLQITGPFTLDAWVSFEGVSPLSSGITNTPIMAKWGNTSNGTAGYGLMVNADGTPWLAVSSNGNDRSIVSSTFKLPADTFTHLAGVWDGEALRLYVNGEEVASVPFTGPTNGNNGTPLLIGGYNPALSGVSNSFVGIIDEVGIYNRALSAAEIQAVYNAGNAGKCQTIDGACGPADGQSYLSAPTTELCSAGAPSTVTGTGPWSWTCSGVNGGTTASCSADLAIPTLTQVTPSSGVQGTTFEVTFTGTNLATASAIVSDNPGISGVISSKTDTSVTASITITTQAATGATTLGLFTDGGAATIPFTVTLAPQPVSFPVHIGTANPNDEEFTTLYLGAGSTVGPLVDDLGHAAWSIAGQATSSQFGYAAGGLSDIQRAVIASQGFVLTLTARVLKGMAAAYDTSHAVIGGATLDTGYRRFDITLGVDSKGDTVVILPSDFGVYGGVAPIYASGSSFTLTGSGSSYHIYQLVYNPDTQLADLYVDGIKRLQDYAGCTTFVGNYGLAFAAWSGGQANFDYVDLAIGSQSLPSPTVTQISQAEADQGDTFNVTFTGTNLKTVNAVVSDNSGVSGSIIERNDTRVTAIITIDPQATTGETSLGLNTLGGTARLPFIITPSIPNIIDATYGMGAGSFELGNFINGGGIPYGNGTGYMGVAPGDSTTITGWTVDGPGDGIDWLTAPYASADSSFLSVDLQHATPSSIFTKISTVVGKSYLLSFSAAAVSGYTNTGVVSAGTLSNQPFTATFSSSWVNQAFTPFTFLFTATEPATTIRFSATGPTTYYGPVIDSVSVIEQPTFHSCFDVHQAGLPDGTYTIDPDSNGNLVDVYCPASSPYVAPVGLCQAEDGATPACRSYVGAAGFNFTGVDFSKPMTYTGTMLNIGGTDVPGNRGLVQLANGDLITATYQAGSLSKISTDGALTPFGSGLDTAHGITQLYDKTLLVGDGWVQKCHIFNTDGVLQRIVNVGPCFYFTQDASGLIWAPLYSPDNGASQIKLLQPDLTTVVNTITHPSMANGATYAVLQLANGNFVVSNHGMPYPTPSGGSLLFFKPDLTPLTFNQPPTGMTLNADGTLSHPDLTGQHGLIQLPNRQILIADFSTDKIIRLNEDGSFVDELTLGTGCSGNGCESAPSGMILDKNGRLLVSTGSNQVRVITFGP